MASAAVFGSTGAVGSQILAALLGTEEFATVHTVSRRVPEATSRKLQAVQEGDTGRWGERLAGLRPAPSVVFNAVGTTRAAAGGLAAQWRIDHDLCIANAQAAKAAGVQTYVFVSSAGTRGWVSGWAPYSRMKVGVEDAIAALGFAQAIILRPGMIIGREAPKAALLERAVEGLGWLGQGVQDRVGQDQRTIGRAAVAAARQAAAGTAPGRVWVLEMADIVRLGRDEWAGAEEQQQQKQQKQQHASAAESPPQG